MKASDYKKQTQLNDLVFDLPMATPNCIWKVRQFPVEQYLLAGKLPTFLAEKIKKTIIENAPAELDAMSEQDFDETLAFTKKAIEYIAIEPRVSSNPQSEDEIAHEDIPQPDFQILQNWIVSGGAADAEKFRGERYESFVASLSKSKLKRTRKHLGGSK